MGSKDKEETRMVLWFLTWTPGYTGKFLGSKGGGIDFGGGNEGYRFRQFDL